MPEGSPERPPKDLWEVFPDRRTFWLHNTVLSIAGIGFLLSVELGTPLANAFWVVAAAAGAWFYLRLFRADGRFLTRFSEITSGYWRVLLTPPRIEERSPTAWMSWTLSLMTLFAFLLVFGVTFVRGWLFALP